MTQANRCAEGDLAVALLRALRGLKRHSLPGPGQASGPEGAAFATLHLLAGLGPTRLSDLAGEIGLDASTVSRHVRSLEQGGYVTRTADPDDGRATLLNVAPAGREALAAALARFRAALTSALSEWDDKDRATLTALVGRLGDDLAARGRDGPSDERMSASPSLHRNPGSPSSHATPVLIPETA